VAQYLIGTSRLIAYPSPEVAALLVVASSRNDGKWIAAVKKQLGITLQACTEEDGVALGFNLQQLVLFMAYVYLVRTGNYTIFASGCSEHVDGLGLISTHQANSSMKKHGLRLLNCILNSEGKLFNERMTTCFVSLQLI
jgi:hypothetical protein